MPSMAPSRVTVMIKPVGALCNLDCTYCYYLPTKDQVFGGHEHRMSLDTLRDILAGMLPQAENEVTIAWQGGEPTLAGLDFFQQAIALQKQYQRPGQLVRHALQTNATLLDDDWCRFLRQQEFLVGVSIDGPPHFHDRYRRDHQGAASADAALRGMRLLQKHAVEYNILCVLNDHNVRHPDEVLGYLLNLGSRWLQFIPAVEWETDAATGEPKLAPYSPRGEDYGRFLCRVFDLWFERYRRRVSVRIIDAVLNQLVLNQTPFCILADACHNQITVEHDGSVFGCDHFVEERWRLGQIGSRDAAPVAMTIEGRPADTIAAAAAAAADHAWMDRIDQERFGTFAARKQSLPPTCDACEFRRFCHGGCPKHRPHGGDVPEATVLCAGYRQFFAHAMPRLQWLAGYLRQNQMPPDPQHIRAATESRFDQTPRNAPCPCGSGLKFKRCHGRT